MSLATTISVQSAVERVKLVYKTSIESVLRADCAALLALKDSRLKVDEVPEDTLEPSITTPVLSTTELSSNEI